MRRCDKAFVAAVLGLALTAGTATSEPVPTASPAIHATQSAATHDTVTGPMDLELGVLDRITGGAYMPDWQRAGRDSFRRTTFISSSYSMPIAQAFAVCFMCSGDAEAVAIANAFGDARANANSFASGFGRSFTRADAVGQPFIIFMPSNFAPPASRTGVGAARPSGVR
jgi:hypothetical protein